MKRNRFADMVPPVPDDFHCAVVDALNRMDRVKPRSHAPVALRIAASLVVILAVGALTFALWNRPDQKDVVVSPNEGLRVVNPTQTPEPDPITETVNPYEDIKLEIGAWESTEEGIKFDWKLSCDGDETLMFAAKAATTLRGDYFQAVGHSIVDFPGDDQLVHLGKEVEGFGCGAVIERTDGRVNDHSDWSAFTDWGVQSELHLVIYVYKPKDGVLISNDYESVIYSDDQPAMLITPMVQTADIRLDQDDSNPLNLSSKLYDAVITPYYHGVELKMDNGFADGIVSENMSQVLETTCEVNRMMLESYGFAEFVKGFVVVMDIRGEGGVGNDGYGETILEIYPED